MRYLGGKKRFGKEISDILKSYAPPDKYPTYIEPFCGCLSITVHMVDDYKTHISDVQKDLILLWKEMKSGKFKYPQTVSKRKWVYYKNKPPSATRAFVGFGCSFGGKWFSSYAGDYCKANADYCKRTRDSLKKMEKSIKKINRIYCKSYDKWETKGCLIYCDPPYENTNKYYAVDKFDSKKFWDNVRRWSKHNIVIVSEFKAPKDFVCIWSKDKVTNWGENKPCKITEKLFIHKKNKK